MESKCWLCLPSSKTTSRTQLSMSGRQGQKLMPIPSYCDATFRDFRKTCKWPCCTAFVSICLMGTLLFCRYVLHSARGRICRFLLCLLVGLNHIVLQVFLKLLHFSLGQRDGFGQCFWKILFFIFEPAYLSSWENPHTPWTKSGFWVFFLTPRLNLGRDFLPHS